MTDLASASPAVPVKNSSYQLAYEPDGTPWTARENFADIIERGLLGPANGPTETLTTSPDAAYLIGRIAPQRLAGADGDPVDADSGEAGTDIGDSADARAGRGVPVTAVEENDPGADEGAAEDGPQLRGLMVPASMGLRCQIPDDQESFTVTASWGVYEPVRSEEEKGESRRYQRTPVEVSKVVAVAELGPATSTIPLRDQVVLRIDAHHQPDRGCRLIEIALCNDLVAPRKIPINAWMYQTALAVTADGAAVFLPVNDPLDDTWEERDDELARLRLQYRDRLEFAIGRTCSVDWTVEDGARRAIEVRTTWLPTCQTPQVAAEEVSGALLDMTELAVAPADRLRSGLDPIVATYSAWLAGERERVGQLPDHLRPIALDAVAEAELAAAQLRAGLDFLLADEEALRCFRFMNDVMAQQRIHTQIAQRRATTPALTVDQARQSVLGDGPKAHSWYTFQLAFILMQLPQLCDPAASRRSGELAKAQLLFFPTGGGKTEAYLGLAAFAFAIRRRQGVVQSADGPLDGSAGVVALMRYTLRLLTAQQFQRAAALVCAAELVRQADMATWGSEPFRIGLWVGTDVSPKYFEEAAEQLRRASSGSGYRLTVLQIQRCPWCGTKIEARDLYADAVRRRIYVYCGDELASCPFSKGGSAGDGVPVLTVDEEIYRLAPSFVIATVDKFARLAREGEAASLFGYVSRRCERHGFVHPDFAHCDIQDGGKHPQKNGAAAAAVRPVGRLRPPDLVIQDELHLITGALGTTVGLFEVAIDLMMSWRTQGGDPVRSLLVASTATARNAADQVRALYGRDVTIFPPQVIDAGRTFFSKELKITKDSPGRRYIGISPTGIRLTTAEIRITEVLLAAGQLLLDRCGIAADPYLSLVGYFSATRELAGMARYLGDDVQTALAKGRPWSALPRRTGTNFGNLNIAELTSRVASADITATLDQMAVSFDPAFDSTDGKVERRALLAAGKSAPSRTVNPYDAILATSMLQVGVDVTRLGLMLVVGQPKNTAEYIQATSRVGRDPRRPGLVLALGNWARPRDLAHFEQFRHYHETFYSQVEALSVTPFSATSIERGLDGVLVSAARVLQAVVPDGVSFERAAGQIQAQWSFATALVDALVSRILRASDEDSAERARQRLLNRIDQWAKRRAYLAELRKSLVYERVTDDARFDALMISAESARARTDVRDMPPFVVPNSMREVQPEINLLVSPIPDNLIYRAPPGAPKWKLPEATP